MHRNYILPCLIGIWYFSEPPYSVGSCRVFLIFCSTFIFLGVNWPSVYYFLTFHFILEYSWWTMSHEFQVYSKVIQFYIYIYLQHLTGCLSGKESARQWRRHRFNPWVRKILWRRNWQPTPVFLPGKSHGQRRLVNYSPWGCKESDMTKRLHNSIFNSTSFTVNRESSKYAALRVCKCECLVLSRVQLFAALWTITLQAPLSMWFMGLIPGSSLTQGSNPSLLHLPHCRHILYPMPSGKAI